mgnify:CR=1 FL=1
MEEYLLNLVNWTKLKLRIHIKSEKGIVYFQEREIWWASLGVNIGSEQNGKNNNFERPVLVLKKFNKSTLWALPVTGQYKKREYYFSLYHQGKQYYFNFSQLRLISSKRLIRKFSILSENDMREIKEAVIKLLK